MAPIIRKTCLITGCSGGGVGSALAEVFKNKGYHVFATARSPAKVPQSLHTAPNVTVLALDVSSTESIATVVEIVRVETGGKLDVLINNAGYGLNMPALDTSIAEAKKLFNTNFFAILQMVQAFRHMLIRARGVVVNNSSMGAYLPIPFITIYQASKAALIAASEGWRLEMAPLGVRVITLVTGGVATNFLANLESITLPEDSYYRSIKAMIEEQPDRVPLGMEPEAFAMDVLRRVENGSSGKFWVGGGSIIARWAAWIFPQSALDMVSLWPKPFTKPLAAEHARRLAEEDMKLA